MHVGVFSDLHLRGPDDPTQGRFLRTLGAHPFDRLVLLGDIFEHWWHFGHDPFPAYRPVVDALRGMPLVFVPGNHDFHALGFFRSELGAEGGAILSEVWDGRRVELLHGDQVDRSFGYRAASAVLRGPVMRALLNTMGPKRAWRFLGDLAGPPGGTPSDVLVAAQLAEASRRIGAGAEIVLMGHTHVPGIYQMPGGCFVNVGDGMTHASWVSVRDGVPTMQTLAP